MGQGGWKGLGWFWVVEVGSSLLPLLSDVLLGFCLWAVLLRGSLMGGFGVWGGFWLFLAPGFAVGSL